jgi:hypothetical protein
MIQFNNLEDFKKYAKEKLQETDFAVLPDVNLINKQEFLNYRNSIRLALISENYNFQFINKPNAILSASPVATENQPNTDLPTE